MPDTVQGFVLIDVDVVALNNAGHDKSTTLDNAVMTKKIYKANACYAYVSGQAWRYWWRQALQQNFGWEMSTVTREKKIAFTAANPIKYPDDDLFGYMRAAKEVIQDSQGKTKSTNVTLTRVSPLKNSALISVAPTAVVQHWSSMSRQEGDAVPFGRDEYCAVMKGMFSIALDQVGTFTSQERTGFKNFNETLKKEAIDCGAELIDDPFVKDANGKPLKQYRLPQTIRTTRICNVLQALEVINGGAMQTCNMGDVTPKLIVLATLNSGNHPFSHLAKNELGKPVFSVEALAQVISDYRQRIKGDIFIGRRMGFMDELEPSLKELAQKKDSNVQYYSVNKAIQEYVKQLETQIP